MIRDFRREEASALVALHRDLMPETPPPTAEGLLHWIETHPPRAHFRCWLAEEDGEPVAFAMARFNWTMSAEGVTWVWAGVREEARGRGLGSRLYEEGESHLLAHGAKKLETFALEGSPGERFAEARGFRRTRSEFLLRLDPRAADLSALPHLRETRASEGFRLAPLREVGDRRSELHAVYAAASADIPADDPEDDVSYDDFEHHVLGDPELEWDGSFVVVSGERDRPVALAFLLVNREQGVAANEMTGTLPEFRGRGLARLAKLATVAWARGNGIGEIATENDGENVAMRTLNESLGYRVRFVRAFLAREV